MSKGPQPSDLRRGRKRTKPANRLSRAAKKSAAVAIEKRREATRAAKLYANKRPKRLFDATREINGVTVTTELPIDEQREVVRAVFASMRSALGHFGLKKDDEETWARAFREIRSAANDYRILRKVGAIRPRNVVDQLEAIEKAAFAMAAALVDLSDATMEWLFADRPRYLRPEIGGSPDNVTQSLRELRDVAFRAELAEMRESMPRRIAEASMPDGVFTPHRVLMRGLVDSALERNLRQADLAREARRLFEIVGPKDVGGRGLSGVETPNERLAKALGKMIRDIFGDASFRKISGVPGRPFHRLMKAVAEYATAEKSANNAFSDVLGEIPKWRDEQLGRPDTKTRREQDVEARAAKSERKRAAPVINELKRISESRVSAVGALDEALFRFGELSAAAREDSAELGAKLVGRREELIKLQKKKDSEWIKPLAISGQPRAKR